MRTIFGFVISFALALAPAWACGAPATQPAPLLLTILHTNDNHGYIHLPGQAQGLSKTATLVRQIRGEMPHVLLLDAGDIIHGTPIERTFKGEAAIDVMNAMGYDAATSGNHEFDQGQDVTRAAFERAKFPMLSANVLDSQTGKPWASLKPYIIREIGGVRVAIFGLTTTQTVQIEWPRTIAGITFADFIPIARDLVPRLREQEHADLVIALTHLGVVDDKKLADAVPGIDIIVGGHSHTRLDEQVWEKGTLITQTGAHAVTLGRIDLVVGERGADGKRAVSINGRDGHWWGHDGATVPAGGEGHAFPDAPLIPLTESIPDDPAVMAAYGPYEEKIKPVLAEVLTQATEPMPVLNAAHHEIAIVQLVADAIRAQAKSDVALAAASQFNARGLVKGPVRVADLYELLGAYTRQHIVVIRAPGARLREMVGKALAGGNLRVEISGFVVDGDRITVGDQPLDDARMYTIAGPAHVIQDYFWQRPGVEILSDDVQAPQIRDAAIAFLRGHAPLHNVVEKRITR